MDRTTEDSFIPIVSIKRNELHLRRDVEILLQRVDIKLSSLVCLDDFNEEKEFDEKDSVHMSLLDHNSMSPQVADLVKKANFTLKDILDHHEDMVGVLSTKI